MTTDPTSPRTLSKDELGDIVVKIQELIWLDYDGWNPDKEWDSAADYIESVANVLTRKGLRPND